MYTTIMHVLRDFFGFGIIRLALIISLIFLIGAMAAWVSGAFRAGYERWRGAGGWRGILAGLGTGLFKVLAVFVLVRVLIIAMQFQAQTFEQQYGRITEKNRSAVLMKWGCPHEQPELTVNQTRKRIWITRQLKPQAENSSVFTESFWKDEARPIKAADGQLPTEISVQEENRDVDVPQKSIVSADVTVQVRNNPRQLGNANYAGYDDVWALRYVVTNSSEHPTTAHFCFALPADTGLFDDLSLRLDGVNALERTKTQDHALHWEAEMAPGAQKTVEIGYRSRGLEHLRYVPKRLSQTGHYRVAIQVEGVSPEKLDYPIGSMPPAEKLNDLQGRSCTLTWKLDNALTSYDIGIKLPVAEQPRYHYARLLSEAPMGLILLLIVFILPRLILGLPVKIGVAVVLATAYFLLYTFMGRLADVMTGFVWPFAISAVTITLLIAWFRWKDPENRMLGIQDWVGFTVLSVLFPLAVIDAERTAFWMQMIYLAILVYVCVLMVWTWWRGATSRK